MKKCLATAILRLFIYTVLICTLGRIALNIGPANYKLINVSVGVLTGAIILGKRVPRALEELRSAINGIGDNISAK